MISTHPCLAADRVPPSSSPGTPRVDPGDGLAGAPGAALVIASASLPKEGESVSGDRIVVRRHAHGALIAVVDVLGHGPKASEVAELAESYLNELDCPPNDPLSEIVDGLHGVLRGTRGAAAMVCLIQGNVLEGCGVGNVDLRSVGVTLPVVLSPGILGAKVRHFRAFSGRLTAGAHVFVFSDGISRHAPFQKLARLGAERACRVLVSEHRHAHDDASAIVLAYEEQVRSETHPEEER